MGWIKELKESIRQAEYNQVMLDRMDEIGFKSDDYDIDKVVQNIKDNDIKIDGNAFVDGRQGGV